MNRREVLAGLSGLAAGGAMAQGQAVAGAGDPVLDKTQAFAYDDLPVKKAASGIEGRSVLSGVVATGEFVEVHETVLPPGASPNPGHAHRPTDMMLVREGMISVEHDGKVDKVGPGGVLFVASGTMHKVTNVGDVPARYFVVEVGRESAKQLV